MCFLNPKPILWNYRKNSVLYISLNLNHKKLGKSNQMNYDWIYFSFDVHCVSNIVGDFRLRPVVKLKKKRQKLN